MQCLFPRGASLTVGSLVNPNKRECLIGRAFSGIREGRHGALRAFDQDQKSLWWRRRFVQLAARLVATSEGRHAPNEVVAPVPSASVSPVAMVNAAASRNRRSAWRVSHSRVSTKDSPPAERTTSLVTSRLPSSKRTARSASLRLMPCFIFSSAAISRKPRSSSSNSPSIRSFWSSDHSPSDTLRGSDMRPY
jgi:hypothetical protein